MRNGAMIGKPLLPHYQLALFKRPREREPSSGQRNPEAAYARLLQNPDLRPPLPLPQSVSVLDFMNQFSSWRRSSLCRWWWILEEALYVTWVFKVCTLLFIVSSVCTCTFFSCNALHIWPFNASPFFVWILLLLVSLRSDVTFGLCVLPSVCEYTFLSVSFPFHMFLFCRKRIRDCVQGTRPLQVLVDEGSVFKTLESLLYWSISILTCLLSAYFLCFPSVFMYVKAVGLVDFFVGAVLLLRGGGAVQSGWSHCPLIGNVPITTRPIDLR